MTGVEAGLQMLALSPDLVGGDLAGFHQRAREAIKFQIVDSYVLTDKEGHQVVNTMVPYGMARPCRLRGGARGSWPGCSARASRS